MGALEYVGTILGKEDTTGDIDVGTDIRTALMDPAVVEDMELAIVGAKVVAAANVGVLVRTAEPMDGAGVPRPKVGVPVTPGVGVPNVPPVVGRLVNNGGVLGIGTLTAEGEFVSVGLGEMVGRAGAEVTPPVVGDGVAKEGAVGTGVGAVVKLFVGDVGAGVAPPPVGVDAEGGFEVLIRVGPCVEGAGDRVGGFI
ncbi:hypothetical protein FisN_10Lu225 [Fistulifera solaris]|uniref:Uncharacterized protein n=1 Tax=Fistulifera solaris TaxID=1519565 RepID=A0A1Z5JU22_FISSO|nr:hypothetical protein FisN_10Lu225 [Fistulifera solaris]|eukprot:GAX17352.1 hypothetical protein FisN_10Lu225 [Fistulifera solaris]